MAKLKAFGSFFRLLVAANPSKFELATLALGTVCAIASGVPFPLMAIVFGELLNDFNTASCTSPEVTSTYQGNVDDKIKLLVYLAVAQFVLIYGHLFCWSMHGARLSQRLRELYLKSLMRQEPAYFDNLSPGAVASRLDGDIATIRSGTADKVGITVATLGFFITCYVVAFIKDAVVAALLLTLVPAYMLMTVLGGHYVEKYAGLVSDAAGKAAAIASEALSNVVVVQAFGASKRLEVGFAEALETSRQHGIHKAIAVGIQSGVLYFVAYSAHALAFWYGSRQIADAVNAPTPGITVGAVFTVIFVLIEASVLLSQVGPWLQMFSSAVAVYEKIRSEIDRTPLIDSTEEAAGLRLTSVQGAFEFRNVKFCYPSRPEITVLEDLTLSIPAQKHTAIVGLSGSGKSTIAALLTRLYDPVSGQILADGHDLTELNIRSLRSYTGLVQQEPALLDRSIIENIAQGLATSPRHDHLQLALVDGRLAQLAAELQTGADLTTAAQKLGADITEVVELVLKAARIAHAHDFITAMQHGYGTIVGATGRLVSGGQKQRVALAMAVVKDPAVLILDEATASLDSSSEMRVQRAIAEASTGRTTITIAHRLSTIASADNIVCMHKGVIVEQGTHAQLMANNSAYANLVRTQSLNTDTKAAIVTSETTDTVAKAAVVEEVRTSSEVSSSDEKAAIKYAAEPEEKTEEEEKEPETPSKSLWTLLKGYAPALRPHALLIFIAFVASIVVGGSYSGEAIIFGNTIGALSPCQTPDAIRRAGDFFGLMFFVIALIEFFANVVSWTGFGIASERLVYTVRTLSFRALFEQDLHWHQSKDRTPNNLLSYITRDGNALAALSGSVIGATFSITVNLIAAIILTHIIAWRIALVCLALVPVLLGSGLMELRVLSRFEERHEKAYSKSVDIGTEAVRSIKTIASYSLDEVTLATYRRSLAGPEKETVKALAQTSFWRAGTYFAANLANALAYWWGAKQILMGNYTQVQFLIVSFALLVGALLWSQMFALAPELTQARAAMARILWLIELGSNKMQGRLAAATADVEAVAESKVAQLDDRTGSTVELKDVHFAYPARPDLPVLKGVNVNIKAGQFCAIVGPSGAGKSTIISLVERLYSVQAGSILIDGVDITRTRDISFRDAVALVPQDSVLFEGTVEFNIGLGARHGHAATLDEIKEACKLANIHDVIESLPDGYKTRCGPHGNQFSGGQKQRLSIARALVRRPRLLILDEPTSALDAESERLLEAGLEKATANITVIAIAHRLRTIRKADVIFLIEDGRCVDYGSHEQLFERSQSYRTNVMHQVVAE